MYHRSVAAVAAVHCCMSGRRFATDLSGVISREIHGPVRGVSRKMMCPCVMCGDVCVIPEMASGCVMSPFLREWTLRLLVWELQFLQWERGQSNCSGVDPLGQDMLSFPSFLRGPWALIGVCGMCGSEVKGCKNRSRVGWPALQVAA